MHILQEFLIQNPHSGVYSCCSANRFVIEAAAERALARNALLLIESTANQVNQFGGYTGMTPTQFRDYVYSITNKISFPKERIILGGDHLGPLTWSSLPESEAMQLACELVEAYAKAGFTKIHLDTSMRLADDCADKPLSNEAIAARSARLCSIAEKVAPSSPVYIIGSEVPIPGGAQNLEDHITITTPAAYLNTVESFKRSFIEHGLESAFERVLGVVVQPGVEFSETEVFSYDSVAAKELISALKQTPGLVFEGHSTDYQSRDCLRSMVRDGIRILKVGPALTFALRESLFALEQIEKELPYRFLRSDFRATLEAVMCKAPDQWHKHYHGDAKGIRMSRAFSFSDRARYYLPDPLVLTSIDLLIANLRHYGIPLVLLSQFLPRQYPRVRDRKLANDPEALIRDWIGDYIDDYMEATLS